jgi:predicted Ser/Thr protein kinase
VGIPHNATQGAVERGKYLILQELGRGGMGVVYLAEDMLLGRRVALKVLRVALSEDAEFVARFRREARAIANLSHPNIINIHSLEEVEGRLSIEMEYAEGGSLQEFLDRPMPPLEAVRMVRDVLDALGTCHARGLIHRDVKPSNVLIAADGRALLADFGLATAGAEAMHEAIKTTSSTSIVLGTPRYAPLEAWDGASPSPAWDVYSVGILLYEALSGKPAITGGTPLSIIKELLQHPLPRLEEVLPGISPELASLVHRMVARDPAERPPDAGTALAALMQTPEGKALGKAPLAATPPARRRRRGTWPHLPDWAWVGMGALTLLCLLGITVLTSHYLELPRHAAVPARLRSTETPPPATPAATPLAALMATPRYPAGPPRYFFDTSSPETGERVVAHWMMTPQNSWEQADILAADDAGWCSMTLRNQGGRLVIEGEWAAYGDKAGGRLAFGNVRGHAEWLEAGETLAAALEFRNVRDNSVDRRSLTARRTEENYTDTRFYLRIEDSELLQPLLYRELMPRRMAWAMLIEQELPAVPGMRCTVPLLASGEAQLSLDGKQDEPIWQRRYFDARGRSGRIEGQAAKARPHLLLRATPDALLLSAQVPAALHPDLCLDIALSCGELQPQLPDTVYTACFSPTGLSDASRREHHRETPWECDWQAAIAAGKAELTFEVRVPLAGLKRDLFRVGMNPWRLNLQVNRGHGTSSAESLCYWGYPELAAARHGMLLHFAKPENPGQAEP